MLKNLERSRCGIFNINEAVTPERFEEACRGGYWQSMLYPMDSILSLWETVIVGEEKAQAIRNGALITLTENALKKVGSDFCRAYTWDGSLLGILRFDAETKQWHPEKVFN